MHFFQHSSFCSVGIEKLYRGPAPLPEWLSLMQQPQPHHLPDATQLHVWAPLTVAEQSGYEGKDDDEDSQEEEEDWIPSSIGGMTRKRRRQDDHDDDNSSSADAGTNAGAAGAADDDDDDDADSDGGDSMEATASNVDGAMDTTTVALAALTDAVSNVDGMDTSTTDVQCFHKYAVAQGDQNANPRRLLALGMHLQETKSMSESNCADSIRLQVRSSV
jgi:hypothetical protein